MTAPVDLTQSTPAERKPRLVADVPSQADRWFQRFTLGAGITVLVLLTLVGLFLETELAVGLLRLGDAVIWAVIVGTFALVVALAASGFVFSRRMGILVLAAAVLTVCLFAWHAWELARLASPRVNTASQLMSPG